MSRCPPGAEEEILKDLYAAVNRFDIPAVLALLDPEILRTEPEGFPNSGTYHGTEAMRKILTEGGRQNWDEGGCFPERFVKEGDKVIAFVRVRVRMKATQEWMEGNVADAFVFRDGKVAEWHTFREEKDALAWAGIEE